MSFSLVLRCCNILNWPSDFLVLTLVCLSHSLGQNVLWVETWAALDTCRVQILAILLGETVGRRGRVFRFGPSGKERQRGLAKVQSVEAWPNAPLWTSSRVRRTTQNVFLTCP